jgi:Ca-activated chloride channel homolog
MSFIWPLMLFSLMLLPILAMAYLLLQRRRRRIAARYSSMGFNLQSGGRTLGFRRHVPAILFLVAISILLVALARPQSDILIPRLEGTIILAFDVSNSMGADDIEPTRLEVAKTTAREFVEAQPSTIEIGVVTFSEGGFSTQSPTNNRDEVLRAIDRLALQRGTSVARGIEAGLNIILADEEGESLTLGERSDTEPMTFPPGTFDSSVIVLLSDGENTSDPDPLEMAQEAANLGVRVHAVGIGTREGAVLNLDGFTVRSHLEEETLQQIAQLTGGFYQAAPSEDELRVIYENLTPEIVVESEKMEVTSIFAGVGVLVMLLGGTLSALWLGRLP